MSSSTKAWAAKSATAKLVPFSIERREVGPQDVELELLFCGICHSDLHQVRDEWGGASYPMVPGHEMVGRVVKVGAKVTRFKVGDLAGVGCLVDSCRTCAPCQSGLEQFCEAGPAWSYNSTEMDRKTITYGGYSSTVVVTEAFTLKVAPGLDLSRVAPLLCAGITTYSPLKHWKAGKGTRVGVVGLGGLGHMAVKLAAAMGAEVTVLSTSKAKAQDAKRLGAHEFEVTSAPGAFEKLKRRFDLIVDTASAAHEYSEYLKTVKIDGTMVLLGVPPPAAVNANALIGGRRSLAGSLIGGLAETQEMLDFCAVKGVLSDVEVIAAKDIDASYERMIRGDVRYRFVIDLKTL
jgi:uncharacterized zinc-type alcohol dehydrogenase-like protein